MDGTPEDQEFTVTVGTTQGQHFTWAGYADNTTDALYRALEVWDDEYRQRHEGTHSEM